MQVVHKKSNRIHHHEIEMHTKKIKFSLGVLIDPTIVLVLILVVEKSTYYISFRREADVRISTNMSTSTGIFF